MSDAYSQLHARFERYFLLRSSADMLDWDAQTTMPRGSSELRGQQLATLRLLAHEQLTAPELAELLERAEQEPVDDPWRRANLSAMRREWIHTAAVPAALTYARTQARSRCVMAWIEARKHDDFASLLPHLQEVLQLTREVAQAKSEQLGVGLYDALLDEYEPGVRESFLSPLFAELERELPPLVDRILERQRTVTLDGVFPIEQQTALGREIATRMGFDFERGRLDVSAHPFCGGAPEDVRITTRYDERDFLSSLLGVVHETGHALYELGLPRAFTRQPVGQAIGMAMHESQSLLMELQAARSPEFLRFLAPRASAHFGRALDAETLIAHAHKVERSLIRVNADEATYPLHIMVRFSLERALLSGDLAMADLPGAFREQMQRLVGTSADTDRDGCLQDVHWPEGAYGYFPSYTLGAIAAAQLFAAALAQQPQISAELAEGSFESLRGFAVEHVHRHGSSLSTEQVLTRATGRSFDSGALLSHLRRRYLGEA